MNLHRANRQQERGAAVAYVLVLILLLTMIATSLFAVVTGNLRAVRFAQTRCLLLNVAEAGIDKAIYMLSKEPSYPGENLTSFSPGRFSVQVAPSDQPALYRIISTAAIDLGDKERRRTLTVDVRINPEGPSARATVIGWTEQ